MTLILAQRLRNCTRTLLLEEADGDDVTPGSSDVVRVRIGREGETDKLSVSSTAATANGSSVTKGAPCTMRLDAQDLDFEAGTYTLAVELQDNADAQDWKTVSRQVFVLEPT